MGGGPVFWFDFNSPYVYLAIHRVDDLLPDAEWRPFAYPFLLGRRGRLEEAARRDPAAAFAAVAPRAEALGLPPLNPPDGLPQSTWSLPPLRAAVFADERGLLKEFTRAAFAKVFVEARTLTDLDNVLAAAGEAGLDPAEVAEAIERPDLKQRVKDNTDAAFERGVNGIPTFEVAGELVWGDDRLEEAAELLRRR
jgi:2-hydroxychromene-2-carboxylate isomerase